MAATAPTKTPTPPAVRNIMYRWKPCKPGYFDPGRSGYKAIIIHSTGGSKAGDIATLTGQTDRKVSVQWYITKTGDIYHFVADADSAYHAGVVVAARYVNHNSIGIEQEHIDGKEGWPDVQVRTAANLCAALQQKHGVMEIVSHAQAAPKRKVDPVDYPWDTFHAYVAEALKAHWGFTAL